MVTIRFSKNKFYDVMAPFFVHDVVALNRYSINTGESGGRQKNQVRPSASCQRIPPYVEVPPDIEAIQIVSYFSAFLYC